MTKTELQSTRDQGPRTMNRQVECFIALGSNLEPRDKYIQRALNLMNEHAQIKVEKVSLIYETSPEGGPEGQPMYLNGVCRIKTSLSPSELLESLQEIEESLGRKRDVFWGPRTIDLDILLYGQKIISTDTLDIPHPLMHERKFVMQPLAEIAPDLMHPMIMMSMQTILDSLGE